MADQFVDLYEVLDLPLDADRNTVRKRVNELYLEAQRNLDHRNFQTRVKYQELFEITLPQARYILLDESRRDEYDRLVKASRAQTGGGLPPVSALGAGAKDAFKVAADPDDALPGASTTLEPLPAVNIDPVKLAQERDELWKKWKSGLQEVLADDQSEESKRLRPNVPTKPEGKSAPATQRATSKQAEINFNFEQANPTANGPVSGDEYTDDNRRRASPEEVDRRRMHHRREVMKDILVTVGLKGMLFGATAVVVPGLAIAIFAMGKLYPRGANQIPPSFVSSPMMWLLFFVLIGLGAFLTARAVSKKMRRQSAEKLAKLPYEELLKIAQKS